jgi:hypothetical protein
MAQALEEGRFIAIGQALDARMTSCGNHPWHKPWKKNEHMRALRAWVERPNDILPGRAAQASYSPNACMHALYSP